MVKAPTLDIDASQEARSHEPDHQHMRIPELPDLYERQPRRVPAMIQAGFALAVASAAFYGAQVLLPEPYRPSDFMGGFEEEMAEAQARGRAEGELSMKIVYDKKLKLLETTAIALQEACRAEFQRGNQLYQETWKRANLSAQLASDLQKQYAQARYSMVQQTTGGDTQYIALASLLGHLGGLVDRDFGKSALDAADAVRSRMMEQIDAASRNGQGVDFSGWSQGLPDPTALQPLPRCDVPQSADTDIQGG